jgi:hypothetical protein
VGRISTSTDSAGSWASLFRVNGDEESNAVFLDASEDFIVINLSPEDDLYENDFDL